MGSIRQKGGAVAKGGRWGGGWGAQVHTTMISAHLQVVYKAGWHHGWVGEVISWHYTCPKMTSAPP